MKVLLVYPEFPDTFWSLKDLLKIMSKKSAFPPLGLLTVAAMLPDSWTQRLVDMNVSKLTDKSLLWADYVLVGAMATQKDSAKKVIARCKKLGRPVVLGGPILENGCDEFPEVDHFIVGESEDTLPVFLADLKAGKPKRIYPQENFADINASPVPRWDLIDPRKYISGMLQVNRGCPFNCSFCSVAKISGRRPRTKSPNRVWRELNAIYGAGFRGAIFVADDNFIGDKKQAKLILRQMIDWQEIHDHPFTFTTEADVTLADDPELMDLMAQAGFRQVFLGIETPNEASLLECGKVQNTKHDLLESVATIQGHGLIPLSGFIVGFDSDDPKTFDTDMIGFIQRSGVVVAMIGMLQAFPGTKLYSRLRQSGRLVTPASGNNTDCYPNFKTKIPIEKLVQGYKRIVGEIYSPKKYYERIRNFLENYRPFTGPKKRINATDVRSLLKVSLRIGLFGGPTASYYYWKTIFVALTKQPRAFPEVVADWVYAAHFLSRARRVQGL